MPATYRAAVEEVAYAGRVVYIGWAKEEVAYETRPFVHKELDILGSRNAMPEDFREVIGMLEAKRFPVDAAVTHVVPFEETPTILEEWSREPARFTKIMVRGELRAKVLQRLAKKREVKKADSSLTNARTYRSELNLPFQGPWYVRGPFTQKDTV